MEKDKKSDMEKVGITFIEIEYLDALFKDVYRIASNTYTIFENLTDLYCYFCPELIDKKLNDRLIFLYDKLFK